MKNICLILFSLILCSCYPDTPIISDNKRPFIVCEVKQLTKGNLCKHYSKKYTNSYINNFESYISGIIILPCRSYQIGDTIKITPHE